jgi:hypothetical protein
MFTNQATPGSAIVHPLQQFVFGPVPELPPPVDAHADHLERFAGDYGSSMIVRVAADRTGLLVQRRDQPAFSVISAIPPKYAATAVDTAPQLPEFGFARVLDGTFINYDLRNQTVVRLRFGSDLTIEGAGTFRVVRAMQQRPM